MREIEKNLRKLSTLIRRRLSRRRCLLAQFLFVLEKGDGNTHQYGNAAEHLERKGRNLAVRDDHGEKPHSGCRRDPQAALLNGQETAHDDAEYAEHQRKMQGVDDQKTEECAVRCAGGNQKGHSKRAFSRRTLGIGEFCKCDQNRRSRDKQQVCLNGNPSDKHDGDNSFSGTDELFSVWIRGRCKRRRNAFMHAHQNLVKENDAQGQSRCGNRIDDASGLQDDRKNGSADDRRHACAAEQVKDLTDDKCQDDLIPDGKRDIAHDQEAGSRTAGDQNKHPNRTDSPRLPWRNQVAERHGSNFRENDFLILQSFRNARHEKQNSSGQEQGHSIQPIALSCAVFCADAGNWF